MMKKWMLAVAGLMIMLPGQSQQLDKSLLDAVHYRSIGSTRHGGRYVDYAVYEKDPGHFYAALASGGVWKTLNHGISFEPVFDETGAISIGDLAMDQNNPDIVWVGTGEANNSRTAYYGDGVYKSTDGGKSWTNMGLTRSMHIGRIIIHPKNSDIVWVAANGPLYDWGGESGLYKTTDGGKSWKKVLAITRDGKDIGVIELAIDPRNPNVLYAATYDKERRPWTFNAGGPASAIYKSSNGGSTWTKLITGLPSGIIGKIGIDVSRSNPNILYANIENCNVEGMTTEERWELMQSGQPLPQGKREYGCEMYRSDNAGKTWRKVSPDDREIGGGPGYYYMQVRIDPNDPDHVYVVSVGMYETKDGGKTWGTPFRFGGDNHGLWINPANSKHIILGYDHGMGVTYDAGQNWYHPDFKAVGQFVAVGYDFAYPYNVYGGLQDNGSVKGPSTKTNYTPITLEDWRTTGGGDGMYNVVDWAENRYLYNESQFGPISRTDMVTGETKSIRYRNMDRWAWNAPIVLSHHNPSTIYHAGNKVIKSTNRGESWEEISGDLTTSDTIKINGTGNIQYCTIVTMEESYLEPGVIWVGTDDGKVWVTKDDGKNWSDVTGNIPDHPGYWVSRVEPSHFDSGTAYMTITGLRNEDYRPFIWKTTDFGKSWTSIASNLPNDPLCVVREHHLNPNMLFAGSTKQVLVSIDGGKSWSPMRSNMPHVAVEDLKIHPRENDLIVATHGRSLYIADISWLSEITPEWLNRQAWLFKPETRVQWKGGRNNHSAFSNFAGESEKPGVPIHYYLADSASVKVEIFDGNRLIFEVEPEKQAGLCTYTWNYQERIRMRTEEEKEQMRQQSQRFRGAAGAARGGRTQQGAAFDWVMGQAGPGDFTVKLTVGNQVFERPFIVMKDHWN